VCACARVRVCACARVIVCACARLHVCHRARVRVHHYFGYDDNQNNRVLIRDYNTVISRIYVPIVHYFQKVRRRAHSTARPCSHGYGWAADGGGALGKGVWGGAAEFFLQSFGHGMPSLTRKKTTEGHF